MLKHFLFAFLLPVLLFGGKSYGQDTESKISDEEMQQFASAIGGLQALNMESQGQMIQVLTDKGMDVQRFNEIQSVLQNPEADIELSEEEADLFEEVALIIQDMQMKVQEDMEILIEKQGLSIRRYEEILNIIQSNPNEMARLQALMGG